MSVCLVLKEKHNKFWVFFFPTKLSIDCCGSLACPEKALHFQIFIKEIGLNTLFQYFNNIFSGISFLIFILKTELSSIIACSSMLDRHVYSIRGI